MDPYHALLVAPSLLLAAVAGWLLFVRHRALLARHALAAANEAERDRLLAVLDSVPDAVLSVDAAQRIVLFNPAAERLLGCTAAMALGSEMSRFIPDESRTRHASAFEGYIHGHAGRPARPLHREVVALRADGSRVAVEASVSATPASTGAGPRLYSVVLRDLSQRKAVQDEVRRIQERYRSVVEQSPDAIWLAEGGRIVLANRAAVSLVGGASVGDLIGRRIEEFVPTMAAAPDAGDVFEAVVMGVTEHRLRRIDGQPRDVEMSTAQVPDHGRMSLQVVMRDIGERKRLERLATERERLLGRVVRIAQTVPGVILEWVRQPDGRTALPFASAMFESLFGMPAAAMADDATPVFDAIHADDRAGFMASLEQSAAAMSACRHEWRHMHPLLGERWLECRAMPRREADGLLIWNAFVMDVTERKEAEQAIAEHRARLLDAERMARFGHFSLDLGSGGWTLSESLCLLLGRAPAGVLSYQEGLVLVHPEDRAGLVAHVRRDVLEARLPLDHIYRMLRADNGQARWMHGLGALQNDAQGQPLRVLGTVQDVTESRLATERLKQSQEELRRLSASLNTAREEERRHFSRELHDELGQRLQAIKLELSSMLATNPDDVALAERVRALLRSVDVTVAATRRIAADLRPAMLDDLGLGAAIEWLAHDWAARARLDIHLDIEPLDDVLTGAAATAVYRIVQEGLTNVTRHARAHSVLIGMRRHGTEVVVAVEDDGFGLAPGDTDKRSSHGLVGIRERARLLGGGATISSAPGGGCRLEVRLPAEVVDSNFSDFGETG